MGKRKLKKATKKSPPGKKAPGKKRGAPKASKGGKPQKSPPRRKATKIKRTSLKKAKASKMESSNPWARIRKEMEIEGKLSPVSDQQLDHFEQVHGIALPRSYRSFCKLFGPGTLNAKISVKISVPDCKTPPYEEWHELSTINKEIWTVAFSELDEYCKQSQLVRKGIFFSWEGGDEYFFWLPSEVTDTKGHEMAVYAIYRDNSVHRLADSFESFVVDVCCRNGLPRVGHLDYDPPVFEALPAK